MSRLEGPGRPERIGRLEGLERFADLPRWDGRGPSVWLEGSGIHLGRPGRVRFLPTPGEPVAFLREGVRIPASARWVSRTERSTDLGAHGTTIGTVEHLLAALHVLGHWSGLAVEVEGPELPILDGSALGWAAALEELEPEPAPEAVRPPSLEVERRGGRVTLEPLARGEEPGLAVRVHFDHPAVGEQGWAGEPARWVELLDARTFGFEAELERLRAAGRGLGGRHDNAVLYTENGPHVPARGPDEPARHKALDALGDLYLVGAPLAARVTADRSSHELHVAAVRAVLAAAEGQGLRTNSRP